MGCKVSNHKARESGLETRVRIFNLLNATVKLYLVLTFKSVDEILKCDHSNESYRAVLSCRAVFYAAQRGSKF